MTKNAGRSTKTHLAAAAVSCLFFATTALADNVTLTLSSSYPTGYSFYSYTATDGSSQNNVPVAPYPVTINGGIYKNQIAYSICYDLNNPSNIGKAYTGHFANNTDFASMEATYLANQLNLAGLYSAPTSLKGAISMAIWEVMFPSSTKTDGSYFPVDPAAKAYEKQASQAVSSGIWTVADSNLYPTFMPDDTTSQRFGMILPNVTPVVTAVITSTPEPGTVSFLVIGLGLTLAGKKFRSPRAARSGKIS